MLLSLMFVLWFYYIDEKSAICQYINMFEKRKNVRFDTHARARIAKLFHEDALLKDLSVTGCRIESTVFADIELHSLHTIEIIPDAASNIGSFEITAEARWIQKGEYSFEAGFLITSSPTGKHFQQFVDYLGWRPKTE
jgi:hypothetical protein